MYTYNGSHVIDDQQPDEVWDERFHPFLQPRIGSLIEPLRNFASQILKLKYLGVFITKWLLLIKLISENFHYPASIHYLEPFLSKLWWSHNWSKLLIIRERFLMSLKIARSDWSQISWTQLKWWLCLVWIYNLTMQ